MSRPTATAPRAPHLLRVLVALAALALMASVSAGCSGTSGQTRNDPTSDPTELTTDETSLPPRPAEPTKIVYTAKASDDSQQRIDAAVADAVEGDVEGAITQLEDVLSSDDQAFLAAFNLGVLHDQEGRLGEARSHYEKALAIEPDFSPAVVNLVRLEMRQGRDPVALADRYASARPDNLEHQLARLEALSLRARHGEVIDGARVVLKRDEANPRARYYLALAHYANKRFPLSGYIIGQALEIDDGDPELHFLHGLVLLELDDETGARRAFQRAVELRPDFPEAQNAVGMLLYKNRDFAESEAAYRTAIRYAPEFQEAWLNLGNLLKAVDRGDEAEEAYRKALELKPGWGDAHFSLGALYLAHEVLDLSSTQGMERLEKARGELLKARDAFNGDAEGSELTERFIAKADKAIQIRQAELELEKMEQGGGGGGDGGDPFGDGGGGDPFEDGGGGGDPFEDGGGGGDEDDKADDGDPFE